MIDDTWPRAGEMRSLWKGTTEFWTNDMPQDDTWEAYRHHSYILPLFRSHMTRDTAAMFPVLQNTVTSTEHECRDLHLPAVSHTENASRKGDAWFWGCQNNTACTAPTTTTPPVPQNLNDRIPAKGCRRLLARPRAHGTGKGDTCQLCGAIVNDKGEITETNKSIQRKLVSKEEKRHSSRTVEGRTELDLVQDEVDEAKRSLEEAHLEEQAAQNKAIEATFRVGQATEEMSQITKLLEANVKPAGQ